MCVCRVMRGEGRLSQSSSSGLTIWLREAITCACAGDRSCAAFPRSDAVLGHVGEVGSGGGSIAAIHQVRDMTLYLNDLTTVMQ